MTDSSVAVIGAAGAILGVLIGSSLSLVIAVLNRKWASRDAHRLRVIEVTERRCAHAEELVELMTTTFFNAYANCLFFLTSPSRRDLLDRAESFVKREAGRDHRS